MKSSRKLRLVIIIALALLASLVVLIVLRSRPDDLDESVATSVSDTSPGPSFQLRVVMPRAGLPLGGILPDAFVKKFDGTPRELRLDHTSPGAQIVSVENNRLEFKADNGWAFIIERDGAGRIARGTHLVFPTGLGGNRVKLDCRPADPTTGEFQSSTRPGSGELSGRFVVELANCENAESGKTSNWPPAPLTVRGSFNGLPRGVR
jgi:hypothetical protein